MLAASTGRVCLQFPDHPRLVDAVEGRHAHVELERAVRLAAEIGDQAGFLEAPDAGQPETRRRQIGSQRRLRRRATQLEVAGEAAVQPVRLEVRCRDVDAQRIAGLTEGAARRQAVRAGHQFHVGARNTRPVDGEVAASGQLLAGEPAVAQHELRGDDGARLQGAAGGQRTVEQGGRHPREAPGVEARQLAAGGKRHVPARIQFAAQRQARLAGPQFETRHADPAALVAGVGSEHEAGVGKLDRQLLARGADAGRNRPVQAG